MSDWLDYQKLAATIYRELEGNAIVTHDDKIRGRDTGLERQIDVSIRANIAGHDLLIIVQAKDHTRPADVNIVGEFKSVIADVGASKGVLICSNGFTETALEYGKTVGIDLCTAHDAQSRKWTMGLKIPLLWIEEDAEVALDIELVPDKLPEEEISFSVDAGKCLISTDGGNTTRSIAQILCDAWNCGQLMRTPNHPHEHVISEVGLRILLGQTFWCPVTRLTYKYQIHRKGWLGTFTFAQCRGIFNLGTGVMRAKAIITDKDIPLQRDASWQDIGDLGVYQAKNPDKNHLCITKSSIVPENIIFTKGDIQALDGQ